MSERQDMDNQPKSEEDIFAAASELPAGERAAYLDQACAGDADLRGRVAALLQSHNTATSFLENPAAGLDLTKTSLLTVSPSEKIGDRIGRYKLLQQIGEGGCGVVYMAEQLEPVRRQVALKVIKLGMDTKSVIARFEAERQALALMDHPNIAKVLEAGATNSGRPYFVMELVRGIKITEFCDKNNLTTRERLGLFVQVCFAIQHAHQKGIIHRDIKPSNILVTLNDGVPLPMVIDFGIAKATQQRLTDKTLFTAFEQFIGTPAYMSPEQAEMNAQGVDTRSDIYSLGVLLYELLTGQTPFAQNDLLQAGIDEIRRIIREMEPVRPSTRLSTMHAGELTVTANHRQVEPPKLIHIVRGELDWIVMKALEKDRARRYETANGFALDVERYLADEPVMACPPSKVYQFRKLVRRHKLVFATALVVLVSLCGGIIASTLAAWRIQLAHRQVVAARDALVVKLRESYLAEAKALQASRQAGQRFKSLEAVQKAAAIAPDMEARNAAIAAFALTDLRVEKLSRFHFTSEMDAEASLACAADLSCYAILDEHGDVAIHAIEDDRTVAVFPSDGLSVVLMEFSPDAQFLKVYYQNQQGEHRTSVWDVNRRRAVLENVPAAFHSTFSPDSRLFVQSHSDSTLSIYELPSGKEVKRMNLASHCLGLGIDSANAQLACVNADGKTVDIYDVKTGEKFHSIVCPAGVGSLAWRPGGKMLATGCDDLRLYLWNTVDGSLQATLSGHSSSIPHALFNHAGTLLASGSWDATVRLWNPDTGQLLLTLPAGGTLEFSLDDRHLGPVTQGYQFGLMEVAESSAWRQLYVPATNVDFTMPSFSPDGTLLAAVLGGHACLWDSATQKLLACVKVNEFCKSLFFSPDERSLIVSMSSNGIIAFPVEKITNGNTVKYNLGGANLIYSRDNLREAAMDQSGRYLAVVDHENNRAVVLDRENPGAKVELSPSPEADYIAMSPDGNWAATGAWLNSDVYIWNARSGELIRKLSMPARTQIAFSPDGQWLATSTTEDQLWKVGTWQPLNPPIPGHDLPHFNFLAFSPDSRLMAITQDGNKIELRETSTSRPLATLESPSANPIARFCFSPDGSQLAVVEWDQKVQLWDLRRLRELLKPLGLDWDAPPYPPAPKPVPVEVVAPTE